MYMCDQRKKICSKKASEHGVLSGGLCACTHTGAHAHTHTHCLCAMAQTMNESVILQHRECSHTADSTGTAEPTSNRDNISVCPQRAAGITMVNFTVPSKLPQRIKALWTILSFVCINISFFNLGYTSESTIPRFVEVQLQTPAAYCKTKRLYLCFEVVQAVIYDHDCCCLRQIENPELWMI